MTYIWKCTTCGQQVEVRRRVADYQVPPTGSEAAHQGCEGQSFTKLPIAPMRIFVHESEDAYWK